MYDIETIKKTLELLKQWDYQFTKVARATGIKRRTLIDWNQREKTDRPLLISKRKKHLNKYTFKQQKEVLEYYFSHGENIAKAVRHFRYLKYGTLRYWVINNPRYVQRHKILKKANYLTEPKN